MSGNPGVGIRVGSDERGGIEVGAIPEAPAAIGETIYVGRASFHMEVELEPGQTAAPVAVVPAPVADVDSGSWFRETPAPAHERTAIIDFSSRLRGPTGPDGVPGAYGGAGSSGFGSNKLISSRWSLGLPLIFGAFFCGLLLSPLTSASFSFSGVRGGKGDKDTRAAAGSAAVPTSHAPSVAVPLAPSAPSPVPAAPVVAPITPIAPADAGRSHHSNLVAGVFTNRSTGAAPTPVWGRAMKKSGLRKASAPRRPAHAGTVVAAASAWVDPWADN